MHILLPYAFMRDLAGCCRALSPQTAYTQQHQSRRQVDSPFKPAAALRAAAAADPRRQRSYRPDICGLSLRRTGATTDSYLMQEGADAVSPRDVLRLVQEEGYTLVDTRIQWSYDEWHVEMEGAEHIPLYRLIEGSSPAQIVRKFGHVLFTEFPFTERNYPEFLTTLQQRFPAKDTKILIACDIGGLLSTNTTRLIASNSFETLFFLQNLGYTNVKFVRGGFCGWRHDEQLVADTQHVIRENLPWFKRPLWLREFFPSPCGWHYVSFCREDCPCGDGDYDHSAR